MSSAYPGGLDNFPTSRTDDTVMATIQAEDHNNYADAINKIEETLGVDPQGSFPTVAERLADGGSSPWDFLAFPFAFDTPGLDVGVTVFEPAIGQFLYDAWIDTLVAFDGTTPQADIGQFTGTDLGGTCGLWQGMGFPRKLSKVDTINVGGGPTTRSIGASLNNHTGTLLSYPDGGGQQGAARFVSTDPLLLVANQSGTRNGLALDSTVGSATLRLLILTP